MHRIVPLIFCLLFVSESFFSGRVTTAQNSGSTSSPVTGDQIAEQLSDSFGPSNIAVSTAWAQSLAIAFRWVSRRVQFYRTMLLDPFLAKIWASHGTPKRSELIVFPRSRLGPFPEKSRLRLNRGSKQGWVLTEANWWMPSKQHPVGLVPQPIIKRGWVMHRIEIGDNQLLFSRRYNPDSLMILAEQLGLAIHEENLRVDQNGLSHEFA